MEKIDLSKYKKIVFFTGAGMSAESGVPTYRGQGGIWKEYNFQEYACQEAFDRDPEKVLDFHEIRRKAVLECYPHKGHEIIANLYNRHHVSVITQNIDGIHQRSGCEDVVELHGSLWRVRCPVHGISKDLEPGFKNRKCPECGNWLRPDITWFGDMLNADVVNKAIAVISCCDLFINIGISGVVYPAAGFPIHAKDNEARCICINPEFPADIEIYDEFIQGKAGDILPKIFC
ncbi:MAG: NAD-dependent deacylase [Gammaproteobacteria bacterium]|nr:MAG: NAD-dependent deacylase [Gammaproteobacteria bacterium]